MADPLVASAKKKTDGKRDRTGLTVGIVCAILALLVAVVLCASAIVNSGVFVRNTVSVTTTNYQINNSMVSYYFNSIYQDYLSSYSSYLSYLGIDTTKSLKSQQAYTGTTWFDFFMSTTKTKLRELSLMAEAAGEAGMSLDDEDQSQITAFFDNLKTRAKTADYAYDAYLAETFGRGVRESDIRDCVEMELLAGKYYESYIDSLTYTDQDYETYYGENTSSFLKTDYKFYKFSADVTEDMTEAEKAAAMATVKETADQFVAATSAEEFDSLLRDYLTAQNAGDEEDSDDASDETDDETALTPEQKIEQTIDETLLVGNEYSDATEVGKWAFEEGRAAGETLLVTGEDSYSVYLMVRPSYREETATRNIRRILIAASVYGDDAATKAKAEEVLATFQNGDKNAESFAALASEFSYDSGTAASGGLYENYMPGENAESDFDAWVWDDARKAGDVEIVTNADYGYDILFYENDGLAVWKEVAREKLRTTDYQAKLDALAEQYAYTENDDKLASIDA